MSIGPIKLVTILTPNLESALSLYRESFDWQEVFEERTVSLAQANRWNSSQLLGARIRTIAGINGGVRFIESDTYDEVPPLRTYGWTALEICVDDVFKYTERAIAAGFHLLNEPVALANTEKPLPLIASQLAGKNGEIVYITQILGEVPNFELPDVSNESGSIFICVLGASNLEFSRTALESKFKLRRASDRQVAIKVINKVYDQPLDNTHRLSSLQLDERNAIEIDQLPNEATSREKKRGFLPPGISVVSVLGEVSEPIVFELPDNALLEILPRS
jgi:hypothetical protein